MRDVFAFAQSQNFTIDAEVVVTLNPAKGHYNDSYTEAQNFFKIPYKRFSLFHKKMDNAINHAV